MAVLLVDSLFHLFLLSLQERANPSQRLLRQDQTGSNNGLAGSKDTITTTLLILRSIDIKNMVLNLSSETHGNRSSVVDRAAQLLGILLDNGEASINLGQTLVTERIGTGQVGSYIAVWSGEVGQDGLGQAGVALVGVLDGLGSVGVALVEGDGVRDDGVGDEMLAIWCVGGLT
jgi:hypothetical protein